MSLIELPSTAHRCPWLETLEQHQHPTTTTCTTTLTSRLTCTCSWTWSVFPHPRATMVGHPGNHREYVDLKFWPFWMSLIELPSTAHRRPWLENPRTTSTADHVHVHDHINVHVNVHVLVDVVGFSSPARDHGWTPRKPPGIRVHQTAYLVREAGFVSSSGAR
jgi:hypothetical protein